MAKRSRKEYETAGGGGQSTASNAPTKKPRAKSSRRAPTRTRRAPAFERLPNFPLDVWYEVFYQLMPQDMVHLAQTSKDFRKVVLNRSTEGCWRAALANLEGLPVRPSDLSIPAYAHLMFSRNCHRCGGARCDYIYWDCRARYCRKCSNALLLKKTHWATLRQTLQAGGFRVTHVPLGTLMPVMTERVVDADWRKTGSCEYRTADVEEFVNTWVQLDEESREDLIQVRQQRMIELRQKPYILDEWREAQEAQEEAARKAEEQARLDKKTQLERERMEDIVERMKALGWSDTYEKMSDTQKAEFIRTKGIVLDKPLTPEAWDEIRPRLMELMPRVKRAQEWRIYLERLCILDEVMLSLRVIHPRYPCVADVAFAVPEVRPFITSRLDVTLSDADYDTLRPVLSAFITRQHEEVTSTLSTLVKTTLKVEELDHPLSLAVANFRCRQCQEYQAHFPEFMAHIWACVDCSPNVYRFEQTLLWKPEGNPPDLYTHAVDARWCKLPLSRSCGKAKASGIKWAMKVVKACGQDPLKVTTAEMDALDVRLMCRRCDPDVYAVMTWRGALDHWKKCRDARDKGHSHMEWEVASEAISALVQPMMTRAITQLSESIRKWSCSRCLSCMRQPLSTVRTHLRQIHGIHDVTDADLYYCPLSATRAYPAVFLISEHIRGLRGYPWTVGLFEALRDGTAMFYQFHEK